MIKYLITQKKLFSKQTNKGTTFFRSKHRRFHLVNCQNYRKTKKRLKVFEEPKATTLIHRWKNNS